MATALRLTESHGYRLRKTIRSWSVRGSDAGFERRTWESVMGSGVVAKASRPLSTAVPANLPLLGSRANSVACLPCATAAVLGK